MNAGNYRFKLTWSSLWHLLLGATRFAWAQGITIPRLVLLLDVSKWQGTINFVTMFLAGAKGVIIKCGQSTAKDLRFDENWAKAKAAGIPRGSYWFYDSRVDPKQQAANWWNWIKADPGELMHFADYEESYGGDWGGWRNFKTFLLEFMKLSKLPVSKIGIYTGYYYWIANSPVNLTDLNWFGQFALWLAWYTNDPGIVKIPKPWTALLLWQFGTPVEGEKFGAESLEIDESYFSGDELQYRKLFGLSGTVEPPIEVTPPTRPEITPDPQLWDAKVIATTRVYARTYPQVADDTQSGLYVYQGEVFRGKLWSGNGYIWLKVESAKDSAFVGKWLAVRSLNGNIKLIQLFPISENIPVDMPELWRLLHDKELGKLWRPNLPEVHPFFPNHFTPFSERWQRLDFEINTLTPSRWTAVNSYQRYRTNLQGFGNRKDKRANFITKENLKSPLPKVEALVCGGALLSGYVDGSDLVVELLNGREDPPEIEWILERPWLYGHAITVDGKGTPRMFPQGKGKPVKFLYIADRNRYSRITIPLAKLVKVDMSQPLPDPYKIYVK